MNANNETRQNQESLSSARLSISGMHCAACNQIIEYRTRKLNGVAKCDVNVTNHTAHVKWDPDRISLNEIIESISSLGYGALPMDAAGAAIDMEHRRNIWRLFVAGFAMMQVMMYALPGYMVPDPQPDGDLTPDIDLLLKLASLAISLPVVFFSALPFFRSALRDIRNRTIGMDIPVSIGIVFTFLGSLWGLATGQPVFFDSLIMFVFLLLAARMLQASIHRKSNAALRELTQLKPVTATRLINYPASSDTETVNASELKPGDLIQAMPGTVIAADGIVMEGHSECNEALMTGESRAISKMPGDPVIGGSLNLNRILLIRAEQVGDNTQLSAMVRMMEQAATRKPRLVQLADRYASLFLAVILMLAVASGIMWYFIDPSRALWIAITIMVITCPCALSLATPGVMAATIGQLARNGMLMAQNGAIETLARATHFAFDKTGTLTQGKQNLVHTIISRPPTNENEFPPLSIATTIAARSNHPVAISIHNGLTEQYPRQLKPATLDAESLSETPGKGLQASINGHIYRLGSLTYISELSGQRINIPAGWADHTISALGDKQGCIALFALDDIIRPDAIILINLLHEQGKTVLLLSGDRSNAVSRTAAELGINTAMANMSPEDKHDAVEKLQSNGAIVAMVGDGMNDGPVLSLADVSIAMGRGAPISQARSDMVLISNDLRDIGYAITVTKTSLSLIKQNISWAILYNLIAIPVAVAGFLAPWHAAIGMSLSSIIVIINSLRIYNVKNRHKLSDNQKYLGIQPA